MEEHGIKLKNFHQVDKQGLVMDVIGAFQAHTDNFITHTASPHTTRSVAVSTAHTDQTMVSSGSVGDGGRSGNVLLRSGGGFQTGNVEVSTGQAIKTAGLSRRASTNDRRFIRVGRWRVRCSRRRHLASSKRR